MQISAIQSNMSFGRTLTKHEEKELSNLEQEAKKELGTDITMATVFDFSLPQKSHDTGIGTSFSNDAQKMAVFLKNTFGVNSIQLQPQGQISDSVHSPYSGTSFSLGMHIIDLNKLTEKEYGNILKEEDLNAPFMNKNIDDTIVDYHNVFSEDGQISMLKKAYDNFKLLDENSQIKTDFKNFKKENEHWLKKDALFEAMAVKNNNRNMLEWDKDEQNVFATKEGNIEIIKQLEQVEDEEGRNIVDFEEFVQFIADKEQKESKNKFNEKGIQVYGDCLIGFSQKDVWTHKSAFDENLEFGCQLESGEYSCWSPAIDFNKIDGEAGELLREKFDIFFKRYDGIRIDAAWQLINPMLLTPLKKDGHDVYDLKGHKLGCPINDDRQPHMGDKIIKGIVFETAQKNNFPLDKIFLEMLGGNSEASLDTVKNTGVKFIHITKYGKHNWGRVKFYESQGYSKQQNLKSGDYIIGPGTHDDESLISQFDTYKNPRAWHLADDLKLNSDELQNNINNWTDAAFAELFTTKNQFATLPDILGSDRRINNPDEIKGNWEYRAGSDYKKDYYENLTHGKGLNFPDALSKALKSKGLHSKLTDRLDYYAGVLREPEKDKKYTDVIV